MYAIIKEGGKQYKIQINNRIIIEKKKKSIGKIIKIKNIIMLFYENKIFYKKKDLKTFKINAQIVSHIKHKKIKILKFKRRKQYKKMLGYRPIYTLIKIISINKKKNGT